MRVDVGIWTKKKLTFMKEDFNEEAYESHWLRFERDMGEVALLSGD